MFLSFEKNLLCGSIFRCDNVFLFEEDSVSQRDLYGACRSRSADAAQARRPPWQEHAAWAIAAVLVMTVPLWRADPQAQGTPPGLQEPNVTDLEPRKDPDVPKGQMAILEGRADQKGQRFRLKSLSVLQPVVVAVIARDRQTDLRLSLLKSGWDTPRLSGSTRGQGSVSFTTRTEGGMHILVQSPDEPAAFALVAWVGDEVTPEVPDVFLTPAEYKAWADRQPAGSVAGPQGGLSTALLGVIALLGAGIVVLLAVLVMRRKHG